MISETVGSGMSSQPRWRFDRHTQLTNPTFGVHRAELDPTLRGFGGIHGGYQAAVALRSMTAAINDPAQAPSRRS